MNSELQSFIQENTGKPNLGDTPQNKGECVGLIELFLDLLKINNPHLWGNAIDLLNDADPTKFQVVYNILGNTSQFPSDGAIPVLGKPFGLQADGTYKGHTGLSIGSTGQLLRLFQQNDPQGSTPSIKTYSYDACIGWLIPKVLLQGGGDSVNDTQKAVQFDKIVTFLNSVGILPTNHSEDYLQNDKLVSSIKGLKADRDNQAKRAGEFDQVCLGLGFTGDSNQVTVNQILAKVTDQNATKKLNQIKTIVNS